jgi:hypothetical protein
VYPRYIEHQSQNQSIGSSAAKTARELAALPESGLLLTLPSKTDRRSIPLCPAWQKYESIPYFST